MPYTALNPKPRKPRATPPPLDRAAIERIGDEAALARRLLARWGLDGPIGEAAAKEDAAA